MKFTALILICIVLAGCAVGTTVSTPPATPGHDRLTIGQGREFNSLLPFINNGFTASELIGLSFSLLVTLGPRGLVPDAAKAVPSLANGGISRDGMTVTYRLRHDLKWQDGQPLDARDVVFTQSQVMDRHSLMPTRDGFDDVARIIAPDPFTVVVHLKRPNRLFPITFLGPESPTGILPQHLLANVRDIPRSAYATHPIGSGPYRIGTWHHGESVSFDADPAWYGGRPAISHIVVRFIPDATTRLTQLRTHEIDAELSASSETAAQARAIPGVRVDAERGPVFMQLSFNLNDPIGSQPAIRLAVAQAIDAPGIAANVSHGLVNGRDGARGLYLWAYDAGAGYLTHDPQAAERRLEGAAWHRASDGIRRSADGRRLAFTLSLRSDRSDDNSAAVQVQQQLRSAGIHVALKAYSAPQFTANDGVIRAGHFTAELSELYGNIEPDPTDFFACGARGMNGYNESGYCDPIADADMARALQATDARIVSRALSRVQRQINAQMPMIVLWEGVDVNIVPSRLKNFSDLLGEPYSNVATWSL